MIEIIREPILLFASFMLGISIGMCIVVHVNGHVYRKTGDCSCANPNK